MTDLPARPSPQKTAEQLGIFRYAVTAAHQETHARLAAAAPWAHWVETRPVLSPLVCWLVDVFAIDNDAFLTLLAREDDKVLIEVLGDEPPDTEPAALQFWTPLAMERPPPNGHGRG